MKVYLDLDLLFDNEKDSVETQIRNLCEYVARGNESSKNIQNALTFIEERIDWDKRAGGNLKEDEVGIVLTFLDNGSDISTIPQFILNNRAII